MEDRKYPTPMEYLEDVFELLEENPFANIRDSLLRSIAYSLAVIAEKM